MVDRARSRRLSVFVSADLVELAEERAAAADAIAKMRFSPVLSGHAGSRVDGCHVFAGIYGATGGLSGPGELEAEYDAAKDMPKLIYVKRLDDRDESLRALLARIQADDQASYKPFVSVEELRSLIQDDLALILTERYEISTLTTSDRGEPNVPRPLTTLIGREKEVADVTELLRSPARLVALVGAGGIGKTRIALEVAALVESSFEDGTFVVPLSPVKDPDNVAPTIARALGLREGERVALDALVGHLASDRVLLVLDNFEHLLGALDVLVRLLGETTNTKILVTSRILLNIRGEAAYEIPPLDVPELESTTDVSAFGAVQLFVERAREVRPTMPMADEELDLVAEICRRLDGLPLAIELAAARCRVLEPKAILDRLDQSFELLRATSRDLPERQRTLVDTIDWSYRLLELEEQDLFERLAVFPSYFSLDGAEVVASPGTDVPTIVASLLDKSLLRGIERDTPEPWFGMLETIRHFALEKLAEKGHLDETFQRHASWLAAVIARASREVRGPRQVFWLERGEFGHDNVRAALRWTRLNDRVTFVKLIRGLAFFWELRGYLYEGRRWTEMGIEAVDQADLAARSGLHRTAGRFARAQGELDEAAAHHLEAVYLAKLAHNKALEALALKDLGVVALENGDLDQARSLTEDSLTLARRHRHMICIAEALNNLGLVFRFEGDPLGARATLEESLHVFEEIGDVQGIARALMNLATAERGLSRFDEALDLYKQSLRRWREVGGRWMIAECLENIAMILAYREDFASAGRLMGAAERLRELVGAPWSGSERDLIAEYVGKVKTALEERSQTDLWDEGRSFDLDAAVDHALAI